MRTPVLGADNSSESLLTIRNEIAIDFLTDELDPLRIRQLHRVSLYGVELEQTGPWTPLEKPGDRL